MISDSNRALCPESERREVWSKRENFLSTETNRRFYSNSQGKFSYPACRLSKARFAASESINGLGSWDLNPLVWRVETKPYRK